MTSLRIATLGKLFALALFVACAPAASVVHAPSRASPRPAPPIAEPPPVVLAPAPPVWSRVAPAFPTNKLESLWGDDAGVIVAVGEGGEIARSSDDGAHWEIVPSGVTAHLFAVGGHGSIIDIGGADGTFLRSEDRGQTFQPVAVGTSEWILDVAVDGDDVYALTGGREYDGGAYDLFVSNDGGRTFHHGPFPGDEWMAGVAVAPGAVYVGLRGKDENAPRIVRSRDHGKTFARVGSLPKNAHLESIAVAGSNVYAAASPPSDRSQDTTIFFRSTDAGATFRRADVPSFGIRPRLYARGDVILATDSSVSRDRGQTWSRLPMSPSIMNACGFWIHAGGRWMVSGGVGQIAHSDDAGATWKEFAPMSEDHFTSVWASPNAPLEVFLGTSRGLRKSIDGGATSFPIAAATPMSPTSIWGTGTGEVYVVAGLARHVFHSNDNGVTFQDVAMPGDRRPGRLTWSERVRGSSADDVYVSTAHGRILHTSDHGVSYDVLETNVDVALSDVWASGPDDIYASGENAILHSFDRGRTWQVHRTSSASYDDCTGGLWGSGPHDVYAACSSGVLHTSDGAQTWDAVAGLPEGITAVSGVGVRADAVYFLRQGGEGGNSLWYTTFFRGADGAFQESPVGLTTGVKAFLAVTPDVLYAAGDYGGFQRGRLAARRE